MLLSTLLACGAPADTDRPVPVGDTGAADTGATDTGGDTDAPRDEVACAAGILDPVDAAAVTVDWSAHLPVVRVDALVVGGPATEARALACAGDASQGDIRGYFTHDPARDGVLATGTLDLGAHDGAALALRVEGAAGEVAWFADIAAGGATALILE